MTYADSVNPDQPAHQRSSLICKLHHRQIEKGLIDESADRVALRSECADSKADLELYYPHMMYDKCSP